MDNVSSIYEVSMSIEDLVFISKLLDQSVNLPTSWLDQETFSVFCQHCAVISDFYVYHQ